MSAGEDGGARCELSASVAPAGCEPLASFADVKVLLFSPSGSRLALGGDDGRLRLFSWPALRCVADVPKAHSDALSDADFSADDSLLLTTGNERAGPAGGCAVWKVGASSLERLAWLGPIGVPAALRVTLRGCRFARDGSGRAFTGANVNGEARIACWQVGSWDRALSSRRVLAEPLTSLSLSPLDGRLLAAGGAEGSLSLVSARTLAPLQRCKGAHMVFVTSLCFSPAGATLASVSADASARCTAAPQPRAPVKAVLRLLAYLLALCLLYIVLLRYGEFVLRLTM